MLRKCRKDQVPVGVIDSNKKCVERVSMNWVPFLLNQFLINSMEAQDKGMEFHYSRLLILIVFIVWNELEDVQFLGLRGNPFLATKYKKLWYTTNKIRQIETNVEFFLYSERIRMCIHNTLCTAPQLVYAYTPIAKFWIDHHHIYIQSKKDP